jgi:hypothetical protein
VKYRDPEGIMKREKERVYMEHPKSTRKVEVKQILGKRVKKGVVQYLVEWQEGKTCDCI